MNNHRFATERLDYGRQLLLAGIHGLHVEDVKKRIVPQISEAAGASLKAAVVVGGLTWIGCNLFRARATRAQAVIACSALAFCADFSWRTRTISSHLFHEVTKEVSKVSDQHWLEMNPVDYA